MKQLELPSCKTYRCDLCVKDPEGLVWVLYTFTPGFDQPQAKILLRRANLTDEQVYSAVQRVCDQPEALMFAELVVRVFTSWQLQWAPWTQVVDTSGEVIDIRITEAEEAAH